MGEFQMMVWPAVTLIGFLFLTALVIAMGTQSTARYEQERRAQSTAGARHGATEAMGAGSGRQQGPRMSAPTGRRPAASDEASGTSGVPARSAGWPGGGHSQFAGVSRTVRSSDSSRSNCASTRGSSQRQK